MDRGNKMLERMEKIEIPLLKAVEVINTLDKVNKSVNKIFNKVIYKNEEY